MQKNEKPPRKGSSSRKRNGQSLSPYEKRWARILYGRGSTHQQIADLVRVSKTTVENLKRKDGDWDEIKLPLFRDIDLLQNLKETLFRLQVTMLSHDESDITADVLNCRKLVVAINDLQNLIDEIGWRDMQLCLKKHIEWIEKHKSKDPLEAAQNHYDWCRDHL